MSSCIPYFLLLTSYSQHKIQCVTGFFFFYVFVFLWHYEFSFFFHTNGQQLFSMQFQIFHLHLWWYCLAWKAQILSTPVVKIHGFIQHTTISSLCTHTFEHHWNLCDCLFSLHVVVFIFGHKCIHITATKIMEHFPMEKIVLCLFYFPADHNCQPYFVSSIDVWSFDFKTLTRTVHIVFSFKLFFFKEV